MSVLTISGPVRGQGHHIGNTVIWTRSSDPLVPLGTTSLSVCSVLQENLHAQKPPITAVSRQLPPEWACKGCQIDEEYRKPLRWFSADLMCALVPGHRRSENSLSSRDGTVTASIRSAEGLALLIRSAEWEKYRS